MSDQGSGYTKIPNALLEEHLPFMKDAELRVTLAVARKTLGWHKSEDRISLSQLTKATGLTRQGVINGVTQAIERGVIMRKKDGQNFIYRLSVTEKLVNEVDQLSERTSQRSRPELVNEVDQLPTKLVNDVDPQKKDIKKDKEIPLFPLPNSDPLLDAAALKFANKQAKHGTSGSWQAEMNLRLPAKQRVAIVDCVGRICGLTALMDAKEKVLIEVHETACWLHENGYTEPSNVDDLYRLYLTDEWRRTNHPRPSLDSFMKFASKQAEAPNATSVMLGQSQAVGVFTGAVENLR